MCVQVEQLTYGEEREPSVSERRATGTCSDACGRICEICDEQTGEQPVVSRVLEDVEHRHRCIAKAVDEDRLELTLEKVECYGSTRQCL